MATCWQRGWHPTSTTTTTTSLDDVLCIFYNILPFILVWMPCFFIFYSSSVILFLRGQGVKWFAVSSHSKEVLGSILGLEPFLCVLSVCRQGISHGSPFSSHSLNICMWGELEMSAGVRHCRWWIISVCYSNASPRWTSNLSRPSPCRRPMISGRASSSPLWPWSQEAVIGNG